ncbi:MAG: hypothetical protein PHO62_07885 [Sulfurimonas sp.]|uniref:hypothetical protein n=1 Tax=Sulfurimonas sp. TaxID=2022749 RepID=UPI00262F4523|nr:hypothetical protein [Sulfurimonas sp.]MDD5373327.1 hypothetical protein [Sulfurimonas sp.]
MSFLNDLGSLSSFNAFTLTKRQSDELLQDIAAEIEIGANFDDILFDLATEDYSKNRKVSAVLKAIASDLEYLEIEDILLKYKIISHDEYVLVKNSNNLAAAIRNIIDLREEGRRFFAWTKNYLLTPGVIAAAGVVLQIPLTETLSKILYTEIIPAITASKGSAPFVVLPFYMENTLWVYVFAALFFVIVGGIWGAWRYLYNTNPAFVYKHFEIKFYDDFFYYFKVIDIIKKSQPTLTVDVIFEEIGQSVSNERIKRFFLDMGEKKDDFWFDFERFGAPFGVVKKIKKYEEHDALFKELNFVENGKKKGFLWFLKTKRDSKMESIYKWTHKVLLMSAYTFVLFYILMTVVAFVGAIVSMI